MPTFKQVDRLSRIDTGRGGAAKPSLRLQDVLSLIGFTSVIAQIVLMRELIVVFYGNEISLGIMLVGWLLWTALGSGLAGKLAARRLEARTLVAGIETLIALVLPLTIFAVRASRLLFQPVPGETLGPGPMFLTSFATLSLFCLLSGGLFAAGSRWCGEETGSSTASAASSVYLLEAAGSGVGGILASLVLIRYCTSFETALLLGLLNLVAAVSIGVRAPSQRRVLLLFVLVAALLIPRAARSLEAASLGLLWRGFDLVESRDSIYGNLALVRTSESHSLFENGLRVLTVPDPAAAEEAVHFALLEHAAPRSLLLVGGGTNGSLGQALQYSSLERVTYVELDPAVLGLAERHFAAAWTQARSDPRVRIHPMDGRLFLKTSPARFDVIIINLPDPSTAQLNRFYTEQFFREAAEKLNPGGVLSFQVTGAENYISQNLADLLRCLLKTLCAVFPEVVVIPGETVHYLAANRPGSLTLDASVLMSRLRQRHLHTQYFREYYIPFRMSRDRLLDLEQQIEPGAATPVNRDFAPIAYYFDVVLWSSRFHSHWPALLESLAVIRFRVVAGGALLVMLALTLAAALAGRRGKSWRLGAAQYRAALGLSVAAMGFTLLGLEVLLLLGFQALYGYVYQQLATLLALLMVGMAVGAWLALRGAAGRSFQGKEAVQRTGEQAQRVSARNDSERAWTGTAFLKLACLQFLAAGAPLLLCAVFDWLERARNQVALLTLIPVVFPALAFLAGLMGGYQFPLASRLYFAAAPPRTPCVEEGGREEGGNPGTLYALDLVGACLGAVALSAYLLPVYGFRSAATLMAVLNLGPAGWAAWAAWDVNPRRTRRL